MTAVTNLSAETCSFGRKMPFRPLIVFFRPSQFRLKGAISAKIGLFRPKELLSAEIDSDGRYTETRKCCQFVSAVILAVITAVMTAVRSDGRTLPSATLLHVSVYMTPSYSPLFNVTL